ncbi:MAG: hypothetical protein NVS9B15_12270 [Acidobacteriaceae bacterium]
MDFGNLIKSVTGGGATPDPNQQQQVAGGLVDVINQHGGIGGFAEKLRGAGLGSQVDSWIGTGENQQVQPQQIQQGLGENVITQLAQRAGVSPAMATTIAAAALPMIINHFTPNGQVPQGNISSGGLGGILGGIFGR